MDYIIHGFSRPEYWSELLFPSPGDLPNPGIQPRSPSLQVDSLPAGYKGSPRILEWVASLFFSGSSQPRIEPVSPALEVKNPPAMWDTWVWSWVWTTPWRRERLPRPVFSLKNSTDHIVHGVAKSWTWLSNFHLTSLHSRGIMIQNIKWTYV